MKNVFDAENTTFDRKEISDVQSINHVLIRTTVTNSLRLLVDLGIKVRNLNMPFAQDQVFANSCYRSFVTVAANKVTIGLYQAELPVILNITRMISTCQSFAGSS